MKKNKKMGRGKGHRSKHQRTFLKESQHALFKCDSETEATTISVQILYSGANKICVVPIRPHTMKCLSKGPCDSDALRTFTEIAKLYKDKYLPGVMTDLLPDVEHIPCFKCGTRCFDFCSFIHVRENNGVFYLFDEPRATCRDCFISNIEPLQKL